MAKAFSLEDGNLNTVPLTSSITRTYKDLDLSFAARPSGDVYKKNDAAAVKQAVKNLLLTNYGEKPFMPYYGGNLNDFLFNLDTEFDEHSINEAVTVAIDNYEPRASVQQVTSKLNPDYNSVTVRVVFKIITTNQLETVQVNLARIR
jgi:phage baseplate assembly protein W